MYLRVLSGILGLKVYVVEADSGEIGGSVSHEYHVLNDCSDAIIYVCEKCKKGESLVDFQCSYVH